MDTVRAQALRERIAHYKGLRRMTLDKGVLDAIENLIAEAEKQLRWLEIAEVTADGLAHADCLRHRSKSKS